MTVKELIEELSKLPDEMEVVISDPGRRYDEYCPITSVTQGNIMDQNADGDPEYYEDREVIVVSS